MNFNNTPTWEKGHGQLAKLNLATSNNNQAEIYAHGAHLTDWRTAKGKQWIFTSRQATFEQGKAIRGGVPIIFPQFNAFGRGPRHGFARTMIWHLLQPNDNQHCALRLESNETTLPLWNHQFAAQFNVDLDDNQLDMTLEVKNTDNKPFQFTAALHTYLAVTDVLQCRLMGLHGLKYWDNDGSDFQSRKQEPSHELKFEGAIDRVYFDSTQSLTLHDGQEQLHIHNSGFNDVVVWNPGPEAAKSMSDMADDEWQRMLCVEAAAIDKPVTLQPGETWKGRQSLQA